MVNFRCTFEKVRSDALEERCKIQLSDKGGEEQTSMRESLSRSVAQQWATAQRELFDLRTRYFQHRPVSSRKEMNEEVIWFKENCTDRAEKVFDAYKDLRKQVLKAEIFYQKMSLQEKRDIIKAFGFGKQYSNTFR
jgi:hypothetical protein